VYIVQNYCFSIGRVVSILDFWYFSCCGMFHESPEQKSTCGNLQSLTARDGRVSCAHGPHHEATSWGTPHLISVLQLRLVLSVWTSFVRSVPQPLPSEYGTLYYYYGTACMECMFRSLQVPYACYCCQNNYNSTRIDQGFTANFVFDLIFIYFLPFCFVSFLSMVQIILTYLD
jgi:hypothetical protein